MRCLLHDLCLLRLSDWWWKRLQGWGWQNSVWKRLPGLGFTETPQAQVRRCGRTQLLQESWQPHNGLVLHHEQKMEMGGLWCPKVLTKNISLVLVGLAANAQNPIDCSEVIWRLQLPIFTSCVSVYSISIFIAVCLFSFRRQTLHYRFSSIKCVQFRFANFASHFIRIQIFQIDFSLILSTSKYFR